MHLQALDTLDLLTSRLRLTISRHDLEAGKTWLARFDNWSPLFSDFVLLETPPYTGPGSRLASITIDHVHRQARFAFVSLPSLNNSFRQRFI